MEGLHDLIEEAKVRFVWWSICIFTICYFLSHTSKSMWTNIPISLIFAFALRTLTNHVEFRWKPPTSPRQMHLSYLEKKQVSINDSRLFVAPPPQKWKRKIDSPIVQEALEEFIDLILRDFVIDLWYSDITPDKEAPDLIHGIVLDALGEVAGRIKEVNLVELLTRDMIDLVGDHIEMFRRNQVYIGVDVMGTLSCKERDECLKHHRMSSKELHPALLSPENEYKYLQQLMGGVIALVLRQREAQCPLVRSFAREFLTCLVIQPLIDLVSPVYINELIEYIVLNSDNVVNMTKVGCDSNKVLQSLPVSKGTADDGQSTGRESAIPRTKETDMAALAKAVALREKAPEVSQSTSSAFHGEVIHPKTSDWARVLDAATQRRTEVLAPENLENMWTRGRNYKDKINRPAKDRQVSRTKGQSKADIHSSDLQKPSTVNKDENPKTDDKAIVQCTQELTPPTECKHIKDNDSKLSHILVGESTSPGSIMDDINANDDPGSRSKARLKRSISTSALKVEPNEERANTNNTKQIIISEEFYSPDFGRQNMDQNFQAASDNMIQAETALSPKLRCRVIGAYFEKIGSKSFAVYSIAVTDSENNTWFVKRRYRNFERLHRQLKDIPNCTLHLPPKRIFSSSTEDAFVHQRCIQLDRYLQDILSIANVAEQHEVWDFLSASSKSYSFGKSPSVMRTLAVNVDDAVDDIVRQFKGVSDGLMRKVVGSSPSSHEASLSVPTRKLSWYVDDIGSQVSGQSSIERANSSSDIEEGCDEDQASASTELGAGEHSSLLHSDNKVDQGKKIDARDLHPLISKQFEESRSVKFEKSGSESKSERTVKDRMSLPSLTANIEDHVGVPPEWSPPNVTVPALNLVDKIFQLNKRGWLRRQVFWISKQILQLVMEDAIDDWLLGQINMLRREDVLAQGIRWVKDALWPEGKFFMKLQLDSGPLDKTEFDQTSSSPHASKSNAYPSSSFEAQLEAARRASYVKKLLLDGAPTALVSLIGQRQYRRCSRDIYYFLQSSICIKQLAYGGLELVIIAVFPELRDLVLDIHKKMGTDTGLPV